MNVSPDLALVFLRVFARCEYSLKRIPGFCLGNEGCEAKANWDAFANAVADQLWLRAEVTDTIRRLLLDLPPWKQVVRNQVAVFEVAQWGSTKSGSRLLESARRVRNNLFHGGKEQRERTIGRDEELVRAALVVVQTAVACHPDVDREFHQQI